MFAGAIQGLEASSDAYDAVSWTIAFLFGGAIPLGSPMEASGGAALLAETLVGTATVLPPLAVLVFPAVAGSLANIIAPVAAVVSMLPIAVDAAARLGANGFAFLLAVLFASATPFSTPAGYQTDLMVYDPGGYEFADSIRVGGSLQLLLAVVTTAGIAALWGL